MRSAFCAAGRGVVAVGADGVVWFGSEHRNGLFRFDPATGACTGGPCQGRGLTRLRIEQRDGAAWLLEPLQYR